MNRSAKSSRVFIPQSEYYVGSSELSWVRAISKNVASTLRDLSVNSITAGILSVLVSITGPTVVVFKSAQAGHLTTAQTTQWLSLVWLGAALFSFILTFRFRMPILGAFSTPTVAFLTTSFANNSLPIIVGSYFISSVLLFAVGATGIFERIMRHVPRPVVMAMLAGVLFPFGLDIFSSTPKFPAIVISMVLAYFISRRLNFVAPILVVLIVGLIVAISERKVHFNSSHFQITTPHWVSPHFSLISIFTVALPMTLLTLSTQFAPGLAVLEANGFARPTNQALMSGGLISFLTAGFLNSGTNTAAISAGIAAGEHAEANKDRRYTAGVVNGVCYLIAGLFAAGVTTFFAGLPVGYLAALGGLGLLPTIANATHDAFHESDYREAAAVTFLITISGITLLKMGAPFWGLVAGVVIHQIVIFNQKVVDKKKP